MFPTIDLTKAEPANGEYRSGDRRGYSYIGCRKTEIHQIRICWQASNPAARHYHLEVQSETLGWYSGPKFSFVVPPGSA